MSTHVNPEWDMPGTAPGPQPATDVTTQMPMGQPLGLGMMAARARPDVQLASPEAVLSSFPPHEVPWSFAVAGGLREYGLAARTSAVLSNFLLCVICTL